jgi:hypothetical protein
MLRARLALNQARRQELLTGAPSRLLVGRARPCGHVGLSPITGREPANTLACLSGYPRATPKPDDIHSRQGSCGCTRTSAGGVALRKCSPNSWMSWTVHSKPVAPADEEKALFEQSERLRIGLWYLPSSTRQRIQSLLMSVCGLLSPSGPA